MERINIKKSFKNSEALLARFGDDPYFDWAIILIVAFIVALTFIGFSVRLFFQINAEANDAGMAAAGSSAIASPAKLDTSNLVNLVSIFQSKEAQMSVFSATYTGPSDPAIPLELTKAGASTAPSGAAGTVGTGATSAPASSKTSAAGAPKASAAPSKTASK